MKTHLDCIPCFVTQALRAARGATADESVHRQILREVLLLTSELDLQKTPVDTAQLIHRKIRELTGSPDPYRQAKREFNRLVCSILPELRAEVEQSSDPLLAALQFSIAANTIDLGQAWELCAEKVTTELKNACCKPLSGKPEFFMQKLQQARRILFLADNVGEIVVDRLLLEQIGLSRVTIAFRGSPVINDATLEDADEAGYGEYLYLESEGFSMIDNGSDAPGTLLHDTSQEFRLVFDKADLIISKGQGNFETLNEVEAPLFFLFKVKCPFVAEQTALPVGSYALLPSGVWP